MCACLCAVVRENEDRMNNFELAKSFLVNIVKTSMVFFKCEKQIVFRTNVKLYTSVVRNKRVLNFE